MNVFLTTILRSFYDFDLYKEVYGQWKGWAMRYTIGVFALLLAIGLVAGTRILHTELVQGREDGKPSVLEDALRQVADQWPESTVTDNTLSTSITGPHAIIIDVEIFGERIREEAITVDTSGATTYANMTTPILITAKEVIAKDDSAEGDNETKIRPLAEFFNNMPQPFTINRANANGFVSDAMVVIHAHIWKFYLLMGAMTWLVLMPVFVIIRLFLLIPLAVAGLVLATFMKRSLNYDASVRVLAMVLIPLTIIEAVALIAFGSGVSTWIKVLVPLGVLAALLTTETKKD
ncbi:MAG: DUF1189 family protein [Alphaproteobacteria bacterium]|nr:DUF1189 family protein [Alphaproteobacteria bacterium]